MFNKNFKVCQFYSLFEVTIFLTNDFCSLFSIKLITVVGSMIIQELLLKIICEKY